jgi:hypothetical protein
MFILIFFFSKALDFQHIEFIDLTASNLGVRGPISQLFGSTKDKKQL